MPITFPAGGLKPSVDADLVVGLAGEAIAYSSAVYRVLTTGLWKVSDSNALTAAARQVDGLALNTAAIGQRVIVVRRDPNLTTGETTGEVLTSGRVVRLSGVPGRLQLATSGPGNNAVVVGVATSGTTMNLEILEGGEVPGGVTYTRTAFVSSAGNDSGASLDDFDQPFASMNAAVGQLAAMYPGQTTTLRLLTDLATGASPSSELNTLLAAGLTIMSHDATVRTVGGTCSFGSAAGALLTLTKVHLANLTKVGRSVASEATAGTITGDADTEIDLLVVSSDDAYTDGVNGINGGVETSGAWSYVPPASSPPLDGEDHEGDGAFEDGGNGTAGTAGNRAWNLTLVGSGLVTSLLGLGGQAGDGGNGGNGGTATGGAGGIGGASNHPTDPEAGGTGGRGENAYARGGNGGNAGQGGDGSIVTKAAGWTITAYDLTGGVMGTPGLGGNGGTATGGAGGGGGAGANGGATGATGTPGTAFDADGSDSGSSADGTDGWIV